MNFPSLSSKTITALRLPLALMVVFIHSFGKPEECAIDWSELGSTDIFNIVRIFGSHVLSHIAVPTFFLISGYLFFIKAQKTDWAFFKKQWKNRVRTLLIPYIIWNALCVLYFVPFKMGDILLKGKPWSGLYDYLRDNFSLSILWNAYSFGGGRITVLHQVTQQNTSPILVPLWFMRDLMVAVLLAPVLCWLIRKTHGAVVILLGILYLLSVQSFIPGMGRTTLFFFGIGAWFALRKENFAQCVEKHKWWTVPIWALLMCVCVYFDGANTDTGLIFHAPMVVVGVFAFIGIVSARQKRILLRPAHEPTTPTLCGRIIDFAASNTFFIYVAHNLFGLHITTIVLKRIPFPPLVSYLLTPFLAIAICLAVLWLMRKIIPRTTAVLVGERRRP